MNHSEKYVEPQAPGQTGDQADAVRIARILHAVAIPAGLLIAGVGVVSAWKEPSLRGASEGMRTLLGSGTCLIASSGLFLAVLGISGIAAMRRLSRQR